MHRLVLLTSLTTLIACGNKGDDDEGTDTDVDDTGTATDGDGDGYAADEDCDDADAAVNPGATEICDGIDNDCDDLVDDGDDSADLSTGGVWYADADGDGHGGSDQAISACEQPSGTTDLGDDCDDGEAAVNPGATEVCDGIDNDCDDLVDDGDDSVDLSTGGVWYADADADGYGDADSRWTGCDQPSDYVVDDTDCDDAAPAVNPGATEVCDDANADEDCSGDADDADSGVDTATMGTWYTDSDADGYGDPSSSWTGCDQPSDLISDDTDCDDGAATTNPGAPELCDGVDNDCDASTLEAGTVSWEDTAGTWSDETATFSAGTSSTPASWTSPAAGTLWFCDDTFYVDLEAAHDLNIYGNTGDEVLDGAGAGTVLDIQTDGISVTLQDITIQNGQGDGANLTTIGYDESGGGIYCDSTAALELDGVTLTANDAADLGGALGAEGCTVDIVDSTVSGNTATWGAGLFFADALVTVTDSVIDTNTAASGGGGVMVYDGVTIDLDDSWVMDNTSGSLGSGVTVYDDTGAGSELTCTSSSAGSAGFSSNSGGDGAIYLQDSTSDFVATSCDLGTVVGGDENDPGAVYNGEDGYLFGYGDDASFTCTAGTCGTTTTTDLGDQDSTYSGDDRARGAIFLANDYGTIDSFGLTMIADSSCLLDHYILSNSSATSTGWTVEWSSLNNTPSSSSVVDHDTDSVGLALEVGTYYAVITGWNCTSSGDASRYYIGRGTATDLDIGTHSGTVETSYTAEMSGTGNTLTVYAASTAQYDGTITSTEL